MVFKARSVQGKFVLFNAISKVEWDASSLIQTLCEVCKGSEGFVEWRSGESGGENADEEGICQIMISDELPKYFPGKVTRRHSLPVRSNSHDVIVF